MSAFSTATLLQGWRDNPVLAREAFGRWRLRTNGGKANYIPALVLLVLAGLTYFFAINSLFSQDMRRSASDLYNGMRSGVELTLILLVLPSLASATITREREQQTWNALLLSRLTSREIVMGKFVGSLIPVMLLLIALAPIDIVSAIIGRISLWRFALSSVLLIEIAIFCAASGVFFSWARRRTSQASANVYGLLGFLTVGTWILYGLAQASLPYSSSDIAFLLWINPYTALYSALDKDAFPSAGLFALALYPLVSAGLLAVVIARLRYGSKELEQ